MVNKKPSQEEHNKSFYDLSFNEGVSLHSIEVHSSEKIDIIENQDEHIHEDKHDTETIDSIGPSDNYEYKGSKYEQMNEYKERNAKESALNIFLLLDASTGQK